MTRIAAYEPAAPVGDSPSMQVLRQLQPHDRWPCSGWEVQVCAVPGEVVTDDKDLIERLRDFPGAVLDGMPLCEEAADAIEALVSSVESLEMIRLDLNIEARRLTMERDAALARVKRLEALVLDANAVRSFDKTLFPYDWEERLQEALAEGDKP